MACGILLPRPGIELRALEVRVPSPKHWTAREVLRCFPFIMVYTIKN